jgi:hypothetical protein
VVAGPQLVDDAARRRLARGVGDDGQGLRHEVPCVRRERRRGDGAHGARRDGWNATGCRSVSHDPGHQAIEPGVPRPRAAGGPRPLGDAAAQGVPGNGLSGDGRRRRGRRAGGARPPAAPPPRPATCRRGARVTVAGAPVAPTRHAAAPRHVAAPASCSLPSLACPAARVPGSAPQGRPPPTRRSAPATSPAAHAAASARNDGSAGPSVRRSAPAPGRRGAPRGRCAAAAPAARAARRAARAAGAARPRARATPEVGPVREALQTIGPSRVPPPNAAAIPGTSASVSPSARIRRCASTSRTRRRSSRDGGGARRGGRRRCPRRRRARRGAPGSARGTPSNGGSRRAVGRRRVRREVDPPADAGVARREPASTARAHPGCTPHWSIVNATASPRASASPSPHSRGTSVPASAAITRVGTPLGRAHAA